jgi:hypothetical protein
MAASDSGDVLTAAAPTDRTSHPAGGSTFHVGEIKLASTLLAAAGRGRGRCARYSAVEIETKAPVSRQGLVLLMRPSSCEQGTEDRGFEVRTWRTYLGAWRKTPNPLCFGATAYESPALPLSYLAARKTIAHSKAATVDRVPSGQGAQGPWNPLPYRCPLSWCRGECRTRGGFENAYGAGNVP